MQYSTCYQQQSQKPSSHIVVWSEDSSVIGSLCGCLPKFTDFKYLSTTLLSKFATLGLYSDLDSDSDPVDLDNTEHVTGNNEVEINKQLKPDFRRYHCYNNQGKALKI